MTKSEQITMLYDEISRQNTWYMWTVGALVMIIIGLSAFIYFVQFRLSQKEIKTVKNNLIREYHLDDLDKTSLNTANDLLSPFNIIFSCKLRRYEIKDTALLVACLRSLRAYKRLQDSSDYVENTMVPLACIELLNALSLELKQSNYVYSMAKQVQELVAELYPKAEDYNETIKEEIETFSANSK